MAPVSSPPQRRQRRIDWFLLGMLAAIALAWAFPKPGAQGGWMQPELVTHIGVALIFFIQGLLLPLTALKEGAMRWKLHLIVQLSTFVVIPLLCLALLLVAGDTIPKDLQLGIFFLGALPSTVSSSVAMTAAANGNVPAAVFNATLSSLLGIIITPILVGLYVHSSHALPIGEVILDLICWLLLPLLVGQCFRPLLGAWAARHRRQLSMVDRVTILLLVYTSFCDSMVWGVWSSHSVGLLLMVAVGAVALFFTIFGLTNIACRALGLNQADKVAAVFCGSKKSLAQGVPMAQIMFAGNPSLGLILLPIMLYHALQLFICGIIASRWRRAFPV